MNEFTQEIWTEFIAGMAEEYPELQNLKLEQSARLSIRLATSRTSMDDLKIGQSRIGGIPDMPRGMEWPRWQNPKSNSIENASPSNLSERPPPLGFIAQIDLNALSVVSTDLPQRGWLYFFYDLDETPAGYDPIHKGGCRVLYADCEPTDLIRTSPPDDAHPAYTGHACRIEARTEITLPDIRDFSFEYESPIFNKYLEASSELTENETFVHHRLLGFPETQQQPMELECQLVSNGLYCGTSEGYKDARVEELKSGAIDWHLLLQIDSHEQGPGWQFYDDGSIYFWIKQQDLKQCHFDDVHLILQCS